MEQLRPHLVVTDLYMPLMDGLTLMWAARERGFKGQFVIVSGYSDFQIARSALKLKPAGYLLKPGGYYRSGPHTHRPGRDGRDAGAGARGAG